MEGIIEYKITPLLKCMLLLLFIFTAKVLASRPQDHETRNSIHHRPYVRTFTKYHHLRTIQWHDIFDTNPFVNQHHGKAKRSIDDIEYLSDSSESLFYSPSSEPNNFTPLKKPLKETIVEKSHISEVKKYRVKAAVLVTDPPTTSGPKISCLYKINRVALSVTPAYDDEKNAQQVVENEDFETPGPLSETTLPNGETVRVEQCPDSRASCYMLLNQDKDGNVTILGQGCWKSSQKAESCDKCTRVIEKLPGTRFCCCTKDYCNADFSNLEEYVVTPKAESTVDKKPPRTDYSHVVAPAILILVAMLVLSLVFKKLYCKKVEEDKHDLSDSVDVEKADIMGTGPDALATGLLCVDNLTLVEHIGHGKYGSVWRGNLGSIPVAVKIYSNATAWQKEAAIYALPHLSHPNILKYYGSEARPALAEGGGGGGAGGAPSRSHLVVLELCAGTLRARLQHAPLHWHEFATLAHGLASALAHLHAVGVNKPCVVHRDVNSSNVLVAWDGSARLADLGLAQEVPARRAHLAPRAITEAGTLRYLAPEALEGALDLLGARAALCAVDVFALGLVLWELLWRTAGAHAAAAPPYSPPYQLQGLATPTLPQMQNLVSRNKVRPPLPKGPVPEARALKIAADTCDECWDHDAEARLTAVCVEERMAELKQMLHAPGPVIHDNNLHPPSTTLTPSAPRRNDATPPPDIAKNSNCAAPRPRRAAPRDGRNACLARNTLAAQPRPAPPVHRSLKDAAAAAAGPPAAGPRLRNLDNCLSVARVNRDRVHEHENSDRAERAYRRPLDYVPNDVSAGAAGAKSTNLAREGGAGGRPRWGVRRFLERRLQKAKLETEVKLLAEVVGGGAGAGRTRTSIINDKPSNLSYPNGRPSELVLADGTFNFEGPCTLSPPNKTLSPTMMMESEMNKSENRVFGFRELPSRHGDEVPSQIFAVIVPKAKPNEDTIFDAQAGSSESIKSVKNSVSSRSLYQSGSSANSESEDSTIKKRLSDNKIPNSGRSSRASINLELDYITNTVDSPFDPNSDCSSSEDEHLMLLSENGGAKITIQTLTKVDNSDAKRKYQSDVLKESSQAKTDYGFCNKYNPKYKSFDNEYSDPNDKENSVNSYAGDNPVYLAALKGDIVTDMDYQPMITIDNAEAVDTCPRSPKPSLKNLSMKRQRSLEQVSEIFSSSADVHLQNPAGRVKTPGDLPVAIRKARRDRALQKGRANESNRLSLYDDRMMFGNSL